MVHFVVPLDHVGIHLLDRVVMKLLIYWRELLNTQALVKALERGQCRFVILSPI